MREVDGPYHHGDLRSALLTEAEAMIAAGGAESVTMREIGRRVGVSRAAPYRHFRDKTALLEEVAAMGFRRLGERLAAVEAEGAGGVEAVRRMGEAYVRFALEHPAQYRLMYGREAVTRVDHPTLRVAADALFEHLVAMIEGLQRAGTIEQSDAGEKAYVAWSAVHGLASLVIDGQILAPVDVDRLIRRTTHTLLEGMRARP